MNIQQDAYYKIIFKKIETVCFSEVNVYPYLDSYFLSLSLEKIQNRIYCLKETFCQNEFDKETFGRYFDYIEKQFIEAINKTQIRLEIKE